MEFIYNDGGRSRYFKATNVGDCVTRAIANATGIDYKEIYDKLKELAKKESVKHHRGHKKSSVRDGVFKETWKKYLDEIGWKHIITAQIGQAKKVHLNEYELPNNQIMIVQVSKHLTCVKNGIIYDTYNCSRDGNRMVYGYWIAPSKKEIEEKKELEEQMQKVKQLQEEHLTQVKQKIELIKKEHKPKIDKLTKKIKELQHQLKLETNRMNKEIKKLKEQDSKELIDKLLDFEETNK